MVLLITVDDVPIKWQPQLFIVRRYFFLNLGANGDQVISNSVSLLMVWFAGIFSIVESHETYLQFFFKARGQKAKLLEFFALEPK